MTTQNTQVLILRDDKGDFYLIGQDVLAAGRVPENKKQALQQALSGEVSGYFFNTDFLNQFTNLKQTNTNIGANVIGGFAFASPQTLQQTGVNVASVNPTQANV